MKMLSPPQTITYSKSPVEALEKVVKSLKLTIKTPKQHHLRIPELPIYLK